MPDRTAGLRRGVIVVAATLALWAPLVVLTGGFGFRIGPLSVSSRRPRNALLIALVAMALAWALAPAGRRSATITTDVKSLGAKVRAWSLRAWRALTHLETSLITRTRAGAATALVVAVALLVVTVGFREGAFVAAGADASGYVSQADLWAHGTLRVGQPLMRELTPQIPAEALAPLAYRPAPDGTTIVPVVAPGLPMLMALFQVAGGRDAVFFVVPLLAGVAIYATHLIARRLAGPWSGAVAAILLAASPSFLFQLTSSPMSDIPATAWWALSLGTLLIEGPWAALGSGLAAGAAILTRSNLAPLAAVPGMLLLFTAWRERSAPRSAMLRLALFVAGAVPAFVAIAWLNTYWYGAPFNSGYGSLNEIYQWRHVGPNLERYPRWFLESQTWIVLLAFAAPWLLRTPPRTVTLLVFAGGVLTCYLAYIPFDVWWFLRFLLPAYPPLLALTAAVIVQAAGRLPVGLRIAAAAAVVGATAWHGVAYAAARATFHSEGEWKYAIAGRYVAEHLPERAVLLATQHSGSARYYSGRVTIRWEWIPPDKLEWMLIEIRRLGYTPYALVEDWEEPAIRERFAGRSALAALDRAPIVELPLGNVRIYALDSGQDGGADRSLP